MKETLNPKMKKLVWYFFKRSPFLHPATHATLFDSSPPTRCPRCSPVRLTCQGHLAWAAPEDQACASDHLKRPTLECNNCLSGIVSQVVSSPLLVPGRLSV